VNNNNNNNNSSSSSSSTKQWNLSDLKVMQVSPNVYTVPLFTEEFCCFMIEEIAHFEASKLPKNRPNSMNNYGLLLNQIGMADFLTKLLTKVLKPLAQGLYAGNTQCAFMTDLDHHHSFVVSYREAQDTSLDMHTDDSDLTVNIALSDAQAFTGAALNLCGISGTRDHRKHQSAYQHVRGQALLHLGTQRHGASPLLTGERHNLIMWCKASTYRLTDIYKDTRQRLPLSDENDPDPVCVSVTYDPDAPLFQTTTTTTSTSKIEFCSN
jgi:hypothetical protein